jgi:predicted nucleic acid-binding Zn ribbon protein
VSIIWENSSDVINLPGPPINMDATSLGREGDWGAGSMAMKCSNCGASNPEGANYCSNCGRDVAPRAVEPADVKQRRCVACGRPIGWDAFVCAYCGHDYRARSKPGTEGYLVTGAVLTIVAGILSILLLTVIVGQAGDMSIESSTLLAISAMCSILGVVGGLMALVRKWFPLAVLGAVCAIFGPAFFFAIPGLVLIVASASRFKEFEKTPEVPPFRP